MMPAILAILFIHIIIAVRWMLIKILSVVINTQRLHKVIISGGYFAVFEQRKRLRLGKLYSLFKKDN